MAHKAEQLGHYPQLLLAGRRINDGMTEWIVDRLVLEMARRSLLIASSNVLVLGLTFKENCPDLRNTRVINLISSLRRFGMVPTVVDPIADPDEAFNKYNLHILPKIPLGQQFTAVISAVPHHPFFHILESEWSDLLIPNGILFDLKGVVPRSLKPIRL